MKNYGCFWILRKTTRVKTLFLICIIIIIIELILDDTQSPTHFVFIKYLRN